MLPEVLEVVLVGAAFPVLWDRLILIALLTLLVSDLAWKIDVLDGKSVAFDVVVQSASAARQLPGMRRIYMRDRLPFQDQRLDDRIDPLEFIGSLVDPAPALYQLLAIGVVSMLCSVEHFVV